MPTFQQPPTEQVTGDSDSDLDLDAQELGEVVEPRGSQDGGHGRTYSPRARAGGFKERGFALRNIQTRIGESRRPPLGIQHDDDALQGLLDDGPQGNDPDRHGQDTHQSRDDASLRVESVSRRPKHHPSFFSRFTGRGTRPATSSLGAHIASSEEDALQKSEDRSDPAATRKIYVAQAQTAKCPPNAVSNARYNAWTFLPVTLYNEFSFFLNLYFLLVALSQIIPALRIGFLSTYVAPLVFVLSVTLGKEALDDLNRRRRDAEANAEGYTVLQFAEDTFEDGGAARERKPSKSSAKSRKASTRGTDARHGGALLDSHADEDFPVDHQHPVQEVIKKSRDVKVGDVLKLGKGQRVPADVVILGSYVNEPASVVPDLSTGIATAGRDLIEHSTEDLVRDAAVVGDIPQPQRQSNSLDDSAVGETFIRTEQLDGETDWKLRMASPLTQKLDIKDLTKVEILAGKPERNINKFVGTIRVGSNSGSYSDHQETPRNGIDAEAHGSTIQSMPLTIDNTAWANTVLASNSTTLAAVIYTGPQTRQAMSTSRSRSKTGLLEQELNALTKILCLLTLLLSVILVALERIEDTGSRKWYIAIPRFIILFSTIIPISLRVNLDMGKTVYSRFIEKDEGLPGAIVRTSTIPEELGRIEYLLSDKTGTLTQNGEFPQYVLILTALISFRNGTEEDPRWDGIIRE